MKILILGCNGMAGFTISKYLSDNGYEVIGIARSKSPIIRTIIQDVQDFKSLEDVINTRNFNVIINCIGILNKDAENNPANAVLLNTYLPHKLVELTKNMQTRIIHMSTDCVFSGKTGGYSENDFPDGETFYDRSKALGEIKDNVNLTLRGSIVGPDIKPNGTGLFNWFMKQKGTVSGYSKAIWSGVTTLELAKIMKVAIEDESVGLMHIVPDNPINKLELLKIFNLNFKENGLDIVANTSYQVNKSLIRSNYDLNYSVPNYEEMVKEMKLWIEQNKKYFSHYTIL
jgi:dTDP-4-dehydrorhamnose reductase